MATKKPAQKAKSNAEIKPKSKRGGSRANAGRKPSEAKSMRQTVDAIVQAANHLTLPPQTPEILNPATESIKPHLGRLLDNLFQLADGGYQRVTRTLEPAGLVMVKRPMMLAIRDADGVPVLGDDGKPMMEVVTDDDGKPIMVEQLAFPHLPPDQLVEVSRSETTADRDRSANIYLIDRAEGKPRQAAEVKTSDGPALRVELYLPDNTRDSER